MNTERSIGIFGVGPSSIAAIDMLGPSTTVFQRSDVRPIPNRSVYTTSMGYGDLFEQHVPAEMLSPMSHMRWVTARGTDILMPTSPGYYMVNFPAVMKKWRAEARMKAAHVEVLPANLKREDVRVEERDGQVTLSIQGGKYHFDQLIDASGTQALLAPQVEKRRVGENFFAEFVCGGTFRGTAPEGQMILAMGAGVGTSWANSSIYQTDEGEPLVDVVFSGYGYRSHYERFKNGDGRARLGKFVEFMQAFPGVTLDPKPVDVYYGMIRAQRTPRPKSQTVFAVGEAGGNAKPISGESFNRALEAGQNAAETINQGGSPADAWRKFYSHHRYDDFTQAAGLLRVKGQMGGWGAGSIDHLGDIYKQGGMTEEYIKHMENFLVQSSLSPTLLWRVLSDSNFRGRVIRITKKLIEMKLQPSKMHTPSGYPFPPLENNK